MEGERVRIPKGNLEMLSELENPENPENYRQWFKAECFICKGKIPASWWHYKFFGNCCRVCNTSKKVNKDKTFTKTSCRRGHPFVEGSFYITNNGWRQCRNCNSERVRVHWRKGHPNV